MKKITILLVVLVLSLTVVEAQMFESPGRNVAARKKAEAVTIHRPTQSASPTYVQRYRSERDRIRSTRSIVGNNAASLMGSERKETITKSREKVSGIGVITARTSTVKWRPRFVLPPPPSHKSTLFKRARSTSSSS